jgi:predicted HicB family RNase H-like nuclease
MPIIRRAVDMSAGLAEESLMARKVGRPGKHGGKGKPVRIDPDLAAKARIVALRRKIPLSDYLSGVIRARVLKDFAKVMQEAGEEGGEK